MGGDWRSEELSAQEVIKKYPDVPKFVVYKTDIQRRGVVFSKEAMKLFDPKIHSAAASCLFSNDEGYKPTGLMFRDGTSVLFHDTGEKRQHRAPYLVDAVDGKLVLTDQDEVLETVDFWERADYFEHKTSTGKNMQVLIGNRPQRFDITGSWYCHFWDTPGGGCKYCPIGVQGGQKKKKGELLLNDPKEIVEVLAEGIKQRGRFANILITTGSILSGKELLDDELNYHIELLQEIGKLFKTEDAAFAAVSEEAEELAEAGVSVAATIWQPSDVAILKNAKNPSLEYMIRISREFERLRLKYNLAVDFDDYRRCGNHPNTDLARLR